MITPNQSVTPLTAIPTRGGHAKASLRIISQRVQMRLQVASNASSSNQTITKYGSDSNGYSCSCIHAYSLIMQPHFQLLRNYFILASTHTTPLLKATKPMTTSAPTYTAYRPIGKSLPTYTFASALPSPRPHTHTHTPSHRTQSFIRPPSTKPRCSCPVSCALCPVPCALCQRIVHSQHRLLQLDQLL